MDLELSSSDLAEAILSRSEKELKDVISSNHNAVNLNIGPNTALGLSAEWPQGIKILLEAGADINQRDLNGKLPIDRACEVQCLPSVRLLLEAGCSLDGYDDICLGISPYMRDYNESITMTIIVGLAERRRRLQKLAEERLPEEILDQLRLQKDRLPDREASTIYAALMENNVPVEPALKVTQKDGSSLYHRCSMTCRVADQLYQAGFRDIDDANNSQETPLMSVGKWSGLLEIFFDHLEYAQWLINKGANSYQRMPRSTASVLHQLCASTGFELGFLYHRNKYKFSRGTRCHDFLLEMLTAEDTDECLCSCSLRGCHTVTEMLRSMFQTLEIWQINRKDEPWLNMVLLVLDYLGPVLTRNSVVCRAIIRFMTFSDMELTHTCCRCGFDTLLEDLDREEIEEIREEEQPMLEELEELVAEFEEKYDELGQPLRDFLLGYWMTRMDEYRSRNDVPDEDEIRRIRELGVTLF